MNAHVSSILLGGRDLDQSKRSTPRVWAGRSSGTTASRCSSSPTAARSSASTAATAWPPTTAPARRAAASAGWSSPTWSAARRGSMRSWRTPRGPAPRSSGPPPPSSGRVRRVLRGGGRLHLEHRLQRPVERTSPTRSRRRRAELQGECGQPGTSTVLEPPFAPGCGRTDEERRTIAEMMVKAPTAGSCWPPRTSTASSRGWWPAVPRSSRSRPSGSTGFVTAPSAIRGQPDPHQRAPSWE
jgi:hypothetical protein